ncbi:MAG: Nre family DNA repair protein [Candidatus Aenigmarchaeota archaeon]|nr:Nre family DNA repair protein [Candidatus Aenigmarchaeota archaeon]
MDFSSDTGSLCARCKGRMWCGKDRCPLLVKFYAQTKAKPLIDSLHLEGSSPPSVFVGRFSYPKVYIGPMLPPQHGDTSLMDTPELWTGMSIDEIVDFRFQLVRGKFLNPVKNFDGKIIEQTREIALAEKSPDAELEFKKKPAGKLVMNDEIQPFGPSALLAKLDVGNVKFDKYIEKAFYDTDLKAREAVISLHERGVLVSKIQKAFSVGAFGVGKNRKFVPTRWSITAVDDTLGKNLMTYTRDYPLINEFRVYEHVQLDNRWLILMLPREWCYELIEAWYPNTIWNPAGRNIEIFSDHEFYDGRTTYADIGGCYYAARLATNELLNREKRQAGVVIMRETHPGYIMPVGVWNVREAVRAAVKNPPYRFATLQEALDFVGRRMDIPVSRWIEKSSILKDTMRQRKLVDFFMAKTT